jgi:hypothetical protein
VDADGAFALTAGDHTFAATSEIRGLGVARLQGGEYIFDEDLTLPIAAVQLLGGEWRGAGVVTVSGSLEWRNNALMSGTGTTRIAAGATAVIFDARLRGRTFENAGTATLIGSSNSTPFSLNLDSDAVFRNLAEGVLELPDGRRQFGRATGAGAATFENAGTFRIEGDGEADDLLTYTSVTFNNAGLIEIAGSELRLSDDSVHTGLVEVDADGAFALTAGDHTFAATSEIRGMGVVQFNGGTNTFAGVYNVNGVTRVSGGTVRFVGIVNIGGDYVQTGGTLRVEIGGGGQDRLNIAGQASLGGTLQVAFVDGFDPAIGSSFDVLTFGSRVGEFGSVLFAGLPGGKDGEEEYLATLLRVNIVAG